MGESNGIKDSMGMVNCTRCPPVGSPPFVLFFSSLYLIFFLFSFVSFLLYSLREIFLPLHFRYAPLNPLNESRKLANS